jgi:membrane fusion protein (multidrug efflux system)
MKKSIIILFVFTTALFTFSCGSEEKAIKGKERKELPAADSLSKSGKKDSQKAVPVEVVEIARGDISNYILLSSNIETEVMADVYARAQGIVEKIYKEEGDFVKKGEALLSLEPEQYALAEQAAAVEYKKQEAKYERLKKMHDKKLLSDEEFDDAKYSLDAMRIKWDEAKLNLDYMIVRSPISGRVGERLAKIGRRIQPTDKLFSVVNNQEVIAVVYVPEKNINQLKVGQKAYIFSENIRKAPFKAWIKRISPVVDPQSGTFKVTIGVKNERQLLRPGMFVNTHIITDVHKNALLIPKAAVVYENQYINVYVVRNHVARKIQLETGYEDNEKIEALSGVKEGDKIVIVGQEGMKDNTKVNIVVDRGVILAADDKGMKN